LLEQLATNDVMSILGVAIVPPHPTQLSLRIAVAFRVTGCRRYPALMYEVRVVEREQLSPTELRELLRWLEEAYDEGPWRQEHWSDVGPGPHALIRDESGELVAHACVDWISVEIGGRTLRAGYLEDVATRADARGHGYGAAVVVGVQREIERRAEIGLLATGEFAFYERLGWTRWTGPTSVRESDGSITRTAEDDDAIMTLLLPQTPTWVSPAMAICRPRRDPEEAW
jgi:aminoglycoside 2'-N-acetyltransferase I